MESVAGTTDGTSVAVKEALDGAIVVDTGQVKSHLDHVVRNAVEETLNKLLDEEADRVCRAQRYERSPDRQDTRAGSYDRRLQTKAGEVTLKVPRLRKLPLETAIIERYKRRESSVEEALIEMYLAGVSMRRVEDITEAAWQGVRRSPTIRAYFERIMKGNRERRKIALVATGHYLLRVMHAMLRDGTPWQESQLASAAA